ncbi:hypothetical protein KKA14_04150 [bacterium]|nr:hypothetical protein [bacterium]
MKKWKYYSGILSFFVVTGCATSSDLDKMKLQIQTDNVAMEQRINAKLEKSIEDLQAKITVITDKMNVISEEMALSRNIQSVQITFNNLKKKIEESEAQVRSFNTRIQELKTDITKSSSTNTNIQQEIGEIEGKMDELIQLLEKKK